VNFMGKRMKRQTIVRSFNLEEKVLHGLDRIVLGTNVSRSWAVNFILKNYIENVMELKKQFPNNTEGDIIQWLGSVKLQEGV
jgi:metal-responsive CopG/Arc/MetJ family transcriptional regulator